jgi:S-(hydroxymethyl)glutathione dehydrogenase / alcohol dehydrogenase
VRTRAAVMLEPGRPLEVEEVELHDPKAGEALLRIEAAGVCHSDLHWMLGHVGGPLPVVLGHEGCGTVVAVGDGVTSVKPGDRCVLILRPNCGRCDYCTTGRPMLCNGRTNPDGTLFDGTTRLRRASGEVLHHYGRLSCFAEHAVIPEEQLLPIGDDIPPDRAALVGCAVVTGFGAVMNTARIEVGSDVAVIGCGGIGLNVVQAARMLGARTVVAVDVDDAHLGFARDFGATATVDARAGDPVARIRELTGGGAHYAFDAFGSPRTMEQAFAAVRAGGTAVQIGLAAEGEHGAISPLELALEEKTLKGSFMGSSRPRVDMPRLLDLYRLGTLELDRLVTRTYTLDQVNEAYDDLQRGKLARGVITFASA